MNLRIVLKIIFFTLFQNQIFAEGNLDSLENAQAGQEQQEQQLQWCRQYSNILGYDITSVNNPRLYQSIGEWLGTPYKYSGESKKGIDCSGLVNKLYKECYDKELLGCTKDLYKNSERIKLSELQEGDLVFFKIKKKRISHVGIYLGQNRFVHSSLQNGVIVSNLEDPYYKKYFFKGGRIKK